nr:hypothetical protein I308_03868 [Cryptococcus tetragattii IND107]
MTTGPSPVILSREYILPYSTLHSIRLHWPTKQSYHLLVQGRATPIRRVCFYTLPKMLPKHPLLAMLLPSNVLR